MALPKMWSTPTPIVVHRLQRHSHGDVCGLRLLGVLPTKGPRAMTHIDTAARAMPQCDRERNPTWGGEDSWDELPEYKRLDYVYMARVAIESLRLNREYKYLEDGWGRTINYADGTTSHDFKPATRMSRLVSEWVVDQ